MSYNRVNSVIFTINARFVLISAINGIRSVVDHVKTHGKGYCAVALGLIAAAVIYTTYHASDVEVYSKMRSNTGSIGLQNNSTRLVRTLHHLISPLASQKVAFTV